MPKKDKFDYFDSFKELTELAVAEADLLVETIKGFSEASEIKSSVDKARELEHKGDIINHEVLNNAGANFITPIEREDIIELAQALDDIIDHMESVIRRFYMYDIHFMHRDALEFASLIKDCCEALDRAMEDFRNFRKSKKVKALILDISTREEKSDALFMEIMHQLYTEDHKRPMRVLIWTQIFERLEQCCDTCELTADIMNAILLKNA